MALVIWGSALVAGFESVHKLLRHGRTNHVGWGIAAAAVGIAGNQLVARYKLTVGRRIRSATMVADAKHSWLDRRAWCPACAHARARWTGRTLRVQVEGFLDPDTPLAAADQIGRSVAAALSAQIPEMRSFTWTARAA